MNGFVVLSAAVIEFAGALIIAVHAGRGLWALAHRRSVRQARGLVLSGCISGLELKLGATLLKTLLLTSWPQIMTFVTVLILRTLLKQLFLWEQRQLDASAGASPGPLRS